MSYESPIRLIEDKVKIEMENMVVRAVQHYDLTIDRDELIKALNYDREQYEKGFEDGKAVSMEIEAIPIEWLTAQAENPSNSDAIRNAIDYIVYKLWAERE